MKWINESNVQFDRGNHEPCIFKFDNSKVWFKPNANCTTQGIRALARRLGQAYGSKEITIKYLWDGDKTTEPRENVVDFYCYAGKYYFCILLPAQEGERCKFKDFEDSEFFV